MDPSHPMADDISSARGSPESGTPSGFLIIETNYKIYALTDSPLQLCILSLFVSFKARYPGFAVGIFTRESIQGAFEKGLTSDQILRYFKSICHSQMLQRAIQSGWPSSVPPTIEDQLRLWERERHRLVSTPGVMYTNIMEGRAYEELRSQAEKMQVLLLDVPSKRILVVSSQGHALLKDMNKHR